MALDQQGIARVGFEIAIRRSHAKRDRARILKANQPDHGALACTNAELTYLGTLDWCLHQRRAYLRRQARQAQGHGIDRLEAMGRAADLLLRGGLHQRVEAEAERLMRQAAQDLTLPLPEPLEPEQFPEPPAEA